MKKLVIVLTLLFIIITSISFAEPIKLTQEKWDIIDDVNLQVNYEIVYQSDSAQYNKSNYWAYPKSGYGDCEDFAIMKQAKLKSHGIPSYLAKVRTEYGDGGLHIVCVVDTDHGTFVLDNKCEYICHYQTHDEYIWIKRQIGDGKWYSIKN